MGYSNIHQHDAGIVVLQHLANMVPQSAWVLWYLDEQDPSVLIVSQVCQTLHMHPQDMIGFHPRSHKNDHGSDSRQFSASVGISI